MSSESELSVMIPDDHTIEKALRNVVKSLPEGFSVNVARAAAEEQLGLEQGFLKAEPWKARSKEIITDAVNDEPSPQKPTKASIVKKPVPKPTKNPAPKPVKKRASTETVSKSNKRQKRAVSESEVSDLSSAAEDDVSDSSVEESEEESPKPTKKKPAPANGRRGKAAAAESQREVKGVEVGVNLNSKSDDEEEEETKSEQDDKEKQQAAADDEESEMSDVLDEAPPRKRRQKSASAETKGKSKATKATKSGAASSKDVSPDEAEIKRLQGWLVKCGIRKVWSIYLKPYDTPKSKIKHLKDMLKEAGMDGRYSVEKASAIKEQRELAADLEAVQEGAKKWGHDGDEEEEEAVAESKPRPRRAAAAARFVDFGDSGDESD